MTLPNDHYTTIYQLAHFTEFYQDDFKKDAPETSIIMH